MSDEVQKTQSLEWIMTLAGLYLGISVVLQFVIYPEPRQYNELMEHCGRKDQFCHCQATKILEQRNLFNVVFVFTGLKPYRHVAGECSQYR